MFDYLNGTAASVLPGAVVLDVGGVGFEILSDARTCGRIQTGAQTKLYTVVRISDDRLIIYGFAERQQRELFHKLTAVSGVGPKLALAVLTGLTPDELITAIAMEDVKALQNVPGIGRKTAQRLLLELREKVDMTLTGESGQGGIPAENRDAAMEAAEALEGLGYAHNEAVRAVSAVRSLGDTPEELVKFALKRFGPKI